MILEVKDVSSGYYIGANIIHEMTLKIPQGQVVALIGPNGCGKSTLLKTIYGFLKPNEGEISFDGVSLVGKRPDEMLYKLKIAYIPQAWGIFPDLTVLDNLKLGMWSYRKDKKRIKSAIDMAFDIFPKLKDKRYKKSGVLSGGMRKMLEVARVMLHKVNFILLDEPTAGLAPIVVQDLIPILKELKERNIGILIVDHNVRMLFEVSDYIYVVSHDGRIIKEDSTERLGEGLSKIIHKWII